MRGLDPPDHGYVRGLSQSYDGHRHMPATSDAREFPIVASSPALHDEIPFSGCPFFSGRFLTILAYVGAGSTCCAIAHKNPTISRAIAVTVTVTVRSLPFAARRR
jgi:hypothetical protein